MTRRWTLLVGALALSLAAPQAASATPQQPAAGAPAPGPDSAAAEALRHLETDADGSVSVTRAADGDVAFVRSTNGGAMLDSHASTPRAAAREQLGQYGDAFGVDGTTSKAVVTQTIDSATGGSVVRAEQVVDGVPVFGGQVVMSLDGQQGLVSVSSATTDATQVPAALVSQARAQRTAVAATAKSHHVDARDLTATLVGRRLYDPALVHVADPAGARPVWQVEVANGSDIRETVLVGTDRGEVALHFNDAPGINRRICDNAGLQLTSSATAVPVCTAAARTETGPTSAVTDVNQAFDNLGATSDAYEQLDGIVLTTMIGGTVAGTQSLLATVRWCYSDQPCPFKNAFWDGRQMVFGTDYAGADDVVGHELTHGYVEHTSALFALHQSGAINESVADTIGEIVDHRNPLSTADDSGWTIAEDVPNLPGGALRSMKDPSLFDQPSKMTDYHGADATVDDGDVHLNDGIGNKTAYLISQGGSFNGRTVTGIDAGDPSLAKTGLLYLETIPRLTSGADYADLGAVLASTCDQLVAAHKGGFTAANCTSVRNATAATELAKQPNDTTAAAPEASASCPTGHTYNLLDTDTDTVHDFGWDFGALWQRTPANGTPTYAHGGTSSLFAWNPDPGAVPNDTLSDATSAPISVPVGWRSYLHLHHAYLFEWTPADSTHPAAYYDGAQVLIEKQLSGGGWTTVSGLPWVNGPTRTLWAQGAGTTKGFGGDSHGYGSSRVDLTSLAGQTIRIRLRVVGDDSGSYLGWFVDDMTFYGCNPLPPSAPTGFAAHGGLGKATVSWRPPTNPGGGVTSYFVVQDDGTSHVVSSSTRSATVRQGFPTSPVRVWVAAQSTNAEGPRVSVLIQPTQASAGFSTRKVQKNRLFSVTGRVTRTSGVGRISGMPVVLQRRISAARPWTTVGSGYTGATGAKVWRVKQGRAMYYRVVALGANAWFGDATPGYVVRTK